ncbi:MAG: phytoene desaturase family protein, partial [Bacilli bacterium]
KFHWRLPMMSVKEPYSYGTFILYLGLVAKKRDWDSHIIFIPENCKQAIDLIQDCVFTGYFPFYGYFRDDAIRPTLQCIVRVPNLKNKQEWTEEEKQRFGNRIVEHLMQHADFATLREEIVTHHAVTPEDLKAWTDVPFGSSASVKSTLSFSGPFRPQAQARNYSNLFFAGASTHPGNGISNVIESARLCAEVLRNRPQP